MKTHGFLIHLKVVIKYCTQKPRRILDVCVYPCTFEHCKLKNAHDMQNYYAKGQNRWLITNYCYIIILKSSHKIKNLWS